MPERELALDSVRPDNARKRGALDLDALDPAALRRGGSAKWSRYAEDVLPAWVAEMDYPLAAPIRDELQRCLGGTALGYPMGGARSGLPAAFAARMADRFGWEPDPARVELLTEVVQGIYLALAAYTRPGDGVVVQTPIYPPFLGAVRATRRRLDENRLRAGDGGFAIDFDALDAVVGPDTRLFLLCNPHNPTGRVFTPRELEAIAERALRHDFVVIADEIHADLVYPGHRHVPFATLGPEVAARTVTLTSATKAFNIPGLRCAVAHFGSSELQQRFDAATWEGLRGGLGSLGVRATVAAWQHAQPWLDDVMAHLEGNRDFVTRFVAEKLPGVVLHPPQSTYLAWLDFGAFELPRSASYFFLKRARVALSDGAEFGDGLAGCARLNFATSRAILTEILGRMARALGEARATA